jgi:Flp pilus assembly protein TadB
MLPAEPSPLLNLLAALLFGGGVFACIVLSVMAVDHFWRRLPEERQEWVGGVLRSIFGDRMAPSDAVLAVVFGNIVAIGAMVMLGVPAVFVILLVAAGLLAPYILYQRASIRRKRDLELALPLALQQVANEMGAGATLETALKRVAMTAPSPADVEIGRLHRRVEVMGIEAAFTEMARRLDSRSFAITAAVIRVGTSSGGKFVEAIKSLSRTLIEIERLNRKIRTASENGRRNLYLMSIIGPLIALASGFVVDHQTPLLEDSFGQVLIGVAVIAFAAAHYIGFKLTRVKV